MSSSSQYYSYLSSLSTLITYVQENLCRPSSSSCNQTASSLLLASYLDIDYDTISHAVILNAYWDSASNADAWTETVTLPSRDQTIEIGVLSHEPNPDPEDIGFGGFLTVLGQDSAPSTSPPPPISPPLTIH